MGDDVEEIASRKEGRPSHRLHHTGHDDFDIPESQLSISLQLAGSCVVIVKAMEPTTRSQTTLS
jgi:hypothetical protein